MKEMKININLTVDTEEIAEQIKELQRLLDDMNFRAEMEKERQEREARRRFIEKFNKEYNEIELKNYNEEE